MTGYARTKRATTAGDVVFALKSVNHRGLDLHFSISPALEVFEPVLRSIVKRNVNRGHVELRVSIERIRNSASSFNRELLDAYLQAFHEAAEAHGLTATPDLNAALRLPGMIVESQAMEPDESLEGELKAGLEECCIELNAFRAREGAELAADMLRRQERIAEAAHELEPLRDGAVAALRARLEQRLAEMSVKLDAQRLTQEVALLADRSDIAEEISRLEIHAGQLGDLLREGGEIGKKLDFLLQEMNRETSTMLSKTVNAGEAGAAISEIALGIKAEIEKIREQSLNVE